MYLCLWLWHTSGCAQGIAQAIAQAIAQIRWSEDKCTPLSGLETGLEWLSPRAKGELKKWLKTSERGVGPRVSYKLKSNLLFVWL